MSEPAASPDPPRRVRKRVMELHRSGERPDEEYTELRAVLAGVAKSQRKLRWRHVDILLDVHFRRRGRSVVRRLSELRETYDRRGQPERYKRLWARVQGLLGDLTVNTHGYNLRLTTRPAEQLWMQINSVLDRIGAAGHQAFVNSGTLLGLVRGDGVVAHDDDVDLAVLLRAETAEAAAYEWLELRRELRGAGVLDVEFEDRGNVHTKAASPDDLKIDLFPGWLSDGALYLFPYCFGDVAADDVVPLKPLATTGSTELPGPARPEALLAANYGDDWRTPDPLFAFDWPSARERFSHFRGFVVEGYGKR